MFDDGERKRGVSKDRLKLKHKHHHHKHHHHKKIREGDHVEAKLDGWTKYYGGKVTGVNDDGTYDILFDDGERKRGVSKDRLKLKHKHHHHKNHENDTAPIAAEEETPTGELQETFAMNDRVEAKCDGWTKYFAGTIIHVHGNGTYDIQFDDGEKKTNVDKDKIRPKTAAFGINDRVEAKCPGWTKYFSGTIRRVNDDGTYDIEFDDGESKRGVTESGKTGIIRKLLENNDNNEIFKYMVGERVQAKCTGWTKYFKGTVTMDNGDDTYGIEFDDGERKST